MGRIIAFLIGAALVLVGGVALVGAVELWQGGAGAETLAQGFLVPASLFTVGGFAIWMGVQAGKR